MLRALFVASILLVIVACSNASVNGLPDKMIPDSCGVAIHFWGNDEKQVKQIADAGFKFIRMDMFWWLVEKEKGKYDFSEFDSLMSALDKYGLRPMFIVSYGNQLYSGSENDKIAPASEEYRRAYAAFAGAAAAHFKGRGVLWEIWNEPNMGGFWQPAPNVEQYTAMAKEACAAIKKADPAAVVLGPTVYSIDFGYLDASFKLGLLDAVDVVSVHPYGHPYPEAAGVTYQALYETLAKYGKKLPVVSSEWGYSSAAMSKEDQARLMIRMFLSGLISDVPLSVWYDWHDDGTEPQNWQHNFGVVHNDFTPKPAYTAMQTLTKYLSGYRPVRRLKTDRGDDFVLVMTNGKDFKLAAWTTAEPHEIKLSIDAPALVLVDMFGKRSKGNLAEGSAKISLSSSVNYIYCPYDTGALNLQ